MENRMNEENHKEVFSALQEARTATEIFPAQNPVHNFGQSKISNESRDKISIEPKGESEKLPTTNFHFPVKPKQEIMPSGKENYSMIEKAIIELSEELANLSELKDAIEQLFNDKKVTDDKFQSEVTTYFNSLRKQFDEFNERFSREIDYARELELKIQNNECKGQIYLLDKALTDERAKITIALDDITKTVKENLQMVSDKCLELKSTDNLIEEAIMKFRSDSMSASENEYRALKQNCESSLRLFTENAQKTLETVKKHSIDFITQCEKENNNLIRQVPGIKGKLGIESWLVVALGCMGIASLVVRLLMG